MIKRRGTVTDMTMLTYLTLYGLLMVVSAIAAAVIASRKNRGISFWAGWAFLVPPALCVLLCLDKYKGKRPRQQTLDEEDAMTG